MKINVQSIKFDADQKLLDFSCDVALTVQPDHGKTVKVRLGIPGDDLIIERTAPTFEDAVVDCVDVLQDQIKKMKEKRFGK